MNSFWQGPNSLQQAKPHSFLLLLQRWLASRIAYLPSSTAITCNTTWQQLLSLSAGHPTFESSLTAPLFPLCYIAICKPFRPGRWKILPKLKNPRTTWHHADLKTNDFVWIRASCLQTIPLLARSFGFATTQAASTKGCLSLQTVAKCKEAPSNWNAPLATTIVSKDRSCWIRMWAGKSDYGSLLAGKGHTLACTRNCNSSPDLGAWVNPRPQTNGFVWACTSCLHAKMGLARSVRFATTQAAASTEGCPSLISSPHIGPHRTNAGNAHQIEGSARLAFQSIDSWRWQLNLNLNFANSPKPLSKSMSRRWLVESLKNVSPPSR